MQLTRVVVGTLKQSARHFRRRSFHTAVSFNMPIKEGDKLPTVDVFEGTPSNKVNIAELFAKKKGILFAVPGAFTPGCSKTHLPGYIEAAEDIRSKGVEVIACVAVNDPFVMDAWGKEHNAEGKIRMLADPAGAFTKTVDLELDLTAVLGNVRSQRYSMLIEDGVVKRLNVEPSPKDMACSLAPAIMGQL